MHAQAVKVAPLAGDVASKRPSVLFGRIEPAAADADVVAHRYGQGVDHVCLLWVVGWLLEGFGQQRKESPPRRRLDGVDAAVEVALAYHGGHVTVFVEEAASLVDVASEEGGGDQGDGHNLGGGQTGLGVVAAADGLQELVAQIVDSGYGIVHRVLPVREGFGRPSNREDIDYRDRGQLGLTTLRRRRTGAHTHL